MSEESPKIRTVSTPKKASMSIHQRIQEVKSKVSYVRKTGELETGRRKSKVVMHDEVTKVLHNPMVEAGINCVPRILPDSINIEMFDRGADKAPKTRFSALFEVDFINVDSPDDLLTYPVFMHSDDFGDKAPGKALSMATKTAKLKIFDLETGEDEEESQEEEKPKFRPVNEDEIKKLRTLLEQAPKSTEERLLKTLRADPTMRTLESLDKINTNVWEFCMNSVKAVLTREKQKLDEWAERQRKITDKDNT